MTPKQSITRNEQKRYKVTLMSSTTTAEDAVRAYLDSTRDPLNSLRELREAIDVIAEEEVQRARNLGAPWTVISKRLGIARQTAVIHYSDAAN